MKRTKIAHPISDQLANIAEDAQALLAATADVAEDKVIAARKRLEAAVEAAKEKGVEAWETVQDETAACVKKTDQVVRSHPYETIGIAFGVGALIGYLLTRRN